MDITANPASQTVFHVLIRNNVTNVMSDSTKLQTASVCNVEKDGSILITRVVSVQKTLNQKNARRNALKEKEMIAKKMQNTC